MFPITSASIRVVRSYDFNSYEYKVSTNQMVTIEDIVATSRQLEQIADKAVADYIAAGRSSKSLQPVEHSPKTPVSSREDGYIVDPSPEYSQERA